MTRIVGYAFVLGLVLLGLAAQSAPVAAQPLSGRGYQLEWTEGFSAVDTSESEIEALANGRGLMHVRSAGLFYTDDTNSPFNESTYHCFGSHLLDADGASEEGHGYCAGVGKRGGVWWVEWQGDLDSGTWQVTGGRGAFHGIVGSGRWANEAALSPDDSVTTWTGSLRLPSHRPM